MLFRAPASRGVKPPVTFRLNEATVAAVNPRLEPFRTPASTGRRWTCYISRGPQYPRQTIDWSPSGRQRLREGGGLLTSPVWRATAAAERERERPRLVPCGPPDSRGVKPPVTSRLEGATVATVNPRLEPIRAPASAGRRWTCYISCMECNSRRREPSTGALQGLNVQRCKAACDLQP